MRNCYKIGYALTGVILAVLTTITNASKSTESPKFTHDKLPVLGKPLVLSGGASAEQKRPLTSVDLALAGAIATMIGDATLHPIDCIKTLQQSNEGVGLSMLAAGRKILSSQGIPGFFSGLGCYVLSDGGAGAIKFATYEAVKKWAKDNVPEDYIGSALFGCAALAFVASSVVLVPGELIKQRMQMGQVSSISNGARTIWKNEGFFGFYTGYTGVCLRDIPYTMLELGLYDNFKALYLKFKNRNLNKNDNEKHISQVDEIVAAAVTGGITGYVTNPLDLIKTKLMVDSAMYSGFSDCLRKTVTENGAMSLLQGGGARVAWLMPFTAIYLPMYELIKRKMEKRSSFGEETALGLKGGAQQSLQRKIGHIKKNVHGRYMLPGKKRTIFSF